MAGDQVSIFVSYAREDAALARQFATALKQEGARVWLDQGELLIGDSLLDRIADAIAEFDFVAALVSAASVQSNWCRKEIALAMSKQLERGARRVTVLPLRVGEVEMPPSLRDVKWACLNVRSLAEGAAQVVADAARHLGRVQGASRSGSAEVHSGTTSRGWGAGAAVSPLVADEAPVRIVGVDTDGVGRPRRDGTRGSTLYRVPLQLNRVPPVPWVAAFRDAWDRPPFWTLMHRPGIALLEGDRIVLDGTTIEELERYHLKTLKLVVRQLNEHVARLREEEEQHAETAGREAVEHDRHVQDVLKSMTFQDEAS